MENIKKSCIYFDSIFLEVTKDKNMHEIINLLIHKVLEKYEKSKVNKIAGEASRDFRQQKNQGK